VEAVFAWPQFDRSSEVIDEDVGVDE